MRYSQPCGKALGLREFSQTFRVATRLVDQQLAFAHRRLEPLRLIVF
jgi:hypothetical protein